MKIEIAYSPCPNDCFIFDALVHNKIDTEGYEFVPILADVETLNQAAFRKQFPVTKLSYHAMAYCCEDYVLLRSGSALGWRCGPLMISKRKISREEVEEGNLLVAIPGKYTTANFLAGIAFPKARKKIEMIFSGIEDAVLNEQVDVGVIIHENRFTYESKGLQKIIDLGDWWERKTACAIPLGGIAARRDLGSTHINRINFLIGKSVYYAMTHPGEAMPYVREHAQEMNDEVMKKHIDLYVTNQTHVLDENGYRAVHKLFEMGRNLNVIPGCSKSYILPRLIPE